ncbi:hypothetical protein Ahy_B06g084692 [Arachis hypogaea]|uniref:Uncharacterized protein n=1 Tax=Arachis hypogaea TaxID=3818 RepID=A0A444YSI9_ARAHY|nr:hypothetical protein Ahy_B06g084692 [Arachis hypogaea]
MSYSDDARPMFWKGAKFGELHLEIGEAVECCTLDGESPVAESITNLRSDPSSMGHVESRVNQQGPPSTKGYLYPKPTPCRKVKEVGDLITGEPATEAPVNGGRNYNGPKVEGEEGLLPGGPEPSVRYHSGRARILTLCQDLRAKGQSQVDSFYGA